MAYERAMEQVHLRYPDDVEAVIPYLSRRSSGVDPLD